MSPFLWALSLGVALWAHTRTPLIFFFLKAPIQGKLLAEYEGPFPSLKPDPVARVMLSWQSLVNDFDEPMDDSKYETVKAFMAYSCALSALVQKEVKQVEAGSAEEVALKSLGAYAASLSLQCSCHGIKLVLDKPKEKWEVDKMLLPEWRPIAMMLPSLDSLEKDMNSLNESPKDFKLLASLLPLFETCAGVAASTVIEDKSLAHLKDPCKAFADKFGQCHLGGAHKPSNFVLEGYRGVCQQVFRSFRSCRRLAHGELPVGAPR